MDNIPSESNWIVTCFGINGHLVRLDQANELHCKRGQTGERSAQ